MTLRRLHKTLFLSIWRLPPSALHTGGNPRIGLVVPSLTIHRRQGFHVPRLPCFSGVMEDYEDYYDEDPMSEDEEDEEDDEEDDNDYGFAMTSQADLSVVPRANYRCFGQSDIKEKQAEAVARVVAVLQVDSDEAAQLLRHFKWSVNRVNDEWFQDEDAVRAAVGLRPTEQAHLTNKAQEQVNPLPLFMNSFPRTWQVF